jgi:hypothetical protein
MQAQLLFTQDGKVVGEIPFDFEIMSQRKFFQQEFERYETFIFPIVSDMQKEACSRQFEELINASDNREVLVVGHINLEISDIQGQAQCHVDLGEDQQILFSIDFDEISNYCEELEKLLIRLHKLLI